MDSVAKTFIFALAGAPTGRASLGLGRDGGGVGGSRGDGCQKSFFATAALGQPYGMWLKVPIEQFAGAAAATLQKLDNPDFGF